MASGAGGSAPACIHTSLSSPLFRWITRVTPPPPHLSLSFHALLNQSGIYFDPRVRSSLCTCTIFFHIVSSFLPTSLFLVTRTIASIETSIIVVFSSCILYTTVRPATEKFEIQGQPDVWLIGVRDILKITFDLGLNGCPLDNKHATGFHEVYLGLDRVAWTGTIGRARSP